MNEELGYIPPEAEPRIPEEEIRESFKRQLIEARTRFYRQPEMAPLPIGIRNGEMPITERIPALAERVRQQEQRLAAMYQGINSGPLFDPRRDPDSNKSRVGFYGDYIESHEGASLAMETVPKNREWRLFVTVKNDPKILNFLARFSEVYHFLTENGLYYKQNTKGTLEHIDGNGPQRAQAIVFYFPSGESALQAVATLFSEFSPSELREMQNSNYDADQIDCDAYGRTRVEQGGTRVVMQDNDGGGEFVIGRGVSLRHCLGQDLRRQATNLDGYYLKLQDLKSASAQDRQIKNATQMAEGLLGENAAAFNSNLDALNRTGNFLRESRLAAGAIYAGTLAGGKLSNNSVPQASEPGENPEAAIGRIFGNPRKTCTLEYDNLGAYRQSISLRRYPETVRIIDDPQTQKRYAIHIRPVVKTEQGKPVRLGNHIFMCEIGELEEIE